jgi:hypothetical protein
MFRWAVADEDGAIVVRTRTAELANTIAHLLSGGELPPRTVDGSSGLARYSTVHDRDDRWAIVGVAGTIHDEPRFGGGYLAVTSDEKLARQLVAKLNELDPEPHKPARRGFGWW